MRTLLVLVCLLCLMYGYGTAPAGELRGQDDPRFQAALTLWLADDETALPELAALAAEGNRAAQVLLARIDVTPWFQGPWLVGLPRKERNALLRAPGGLSGRSWDAGPQPRTRRLPASGWFYPPPTQPPKPRSPLQR